MQKMTIKLQEALQSAQRLAMQSAHSELKGNHVLYELLRQEGGIVTPILEQAQVNPQQLQSKVVL